MLKKVLCLFCLLLLPLFFGCAKEKSGLLKVGVTPGPQAKIVDYIKGRAERDGFFFEIVMYDTFEFADNYIKINAALKEGQIDLNCFQNLFYLEETNKSMQTDFVVAAKCYLAPMGIYSLKHSALSVLPPGALVAIPDDFIGMARSLFLLEREGLITLKKSASPSMEDVSGNPLQLKIIPTDSYSICENILTADLNLLSIDYALSAALTPQDALALEDSLSSFTQLIVTRANSAEDPRLLEFLSYYHSSEIKKFIKENFRNTLIPAW